MSLAKCFNGMLGTEGTRVYILYNCNMHVYYAYLQWNYDNLKFIGDLTITMQLTNVGSETKSNESYFHNH